MHLNCVEVHFRFCIIAPCRVAVVGLSTFYTDPHNFQVLFEHSVFFAFDGLFRFLYCTFLL